jgi:protein SCO1/2
MKSRPYFFLLILIFSGCKQEEKRKDSPKKEEYLPYYTTPDFTPCWIKKGSTSLDTIHRIPAFSFTDQEGRTISEKTVEGKIYVTDFFFTSCQGICPKLTKNLKMIQDSFMNDPGVMILSHSVTPEKDGRPALKRYAISHHIDSRNWFLLTGNRDSIYTIARKSYFADEDLGMQRGSEDFLHTENILLVDGNRHIRGIYKGTSPMEMLHLVQDIRLLKKER